MRIKIQSPPKNNFRLAFNKQYGAGSSYIYSRQVGTGTSFFSVLIPYSHIVKKNSISLTDGSSNFCLYFHLFFALMLPLYLNISYIFLFLSNFCSKRQADIRQLPRGGEGYFPINRNTPAYFFHACSTTQIKTHRNLTI